LTLKSIEELTSDIKVCTVNIRLNSYLLFKLKKILHNMSFD